MARIRSVKPTFWTDEKMGRLPREARLTYLGLISAMSDDHGRLSGSARIVRGAVYPFDEDISTADVERHLVLLAAAGRIIRYKVEGDDYIAIVNWYRHQKVDRPSASLLPEPPATDISNEGQTERSTPIRRMFADSSTTVPAGEEGSGTDRNGREETPPPAPRAREVGQQAEARVLLEAFPRLADALPPRDGHDVLLEFAVRVVDKRAYLAEAVAALDGMHGVVLTPDELRVAITDWLTNNEQPNLRRFRGYLRGVKPLPGTAVTAGKSAQGGARNDPDLDGWLANRQARRSGVNG